MPDEAPEPAIAGDGEMLTACIDLISLLLSRNQGIGREDPWWDESAFGYYLR